MGMTNKQFQGFVRLTLAQIERALKESPENKELQELKDIFQDSQGLMINPSKQI